MFQKMITRRNLVLGTASLAASLLASCSASKKSVSSPTSVPTSTPPASPTPTSAPASSPTATQASVPTPTSAPSPTPTLAPQIMLVWIDSAMPSTFGPIAEQFIAHLASDATSGPIEIERVDAKDSADLIFSTIPLTEPASAQSLATTYLVPVCSPRTPVLGVTSDQMAAMLSGAATDWTSAGSPTSIAVEPFVIDGYNVPGTKADAVTVATFEDLVAQLPNHPGAIALAAVDDVDFRMSSLTVDGVDVMTATEPPENWPYAIELRVTANGDAQRYLDTLAEQTSNLSASDATPPPLTVTFVGDVILGRTVHTILTRLGDFAAPFRLVADELKRTDLTIANLECSLSDDITPPTDPYTFSFMTFTAGGDGLALAGVDAVTQANNHSMNFGARGMRDTLAALDQRKIQHFGIGENLTEARKPLILEAQGRKIAFLGYDGITGTTYGATESTAGTSPLDVDNMAEDIAAARQHADIVIPFVHWGIEYQLVPSAEQQSIARNAIDVGADIVIGSHCHWVQGMEVYNGKPIIYSLANFVFDQEWSLETKQGLIMHLVFRQNRVVGIRFVPVLIEDFYQPHLVDGATKVQILNRIWQSTDLIASTL
jgi:poly-gamma-glutamate capsule biosynthesis protein CapA/YwtB (metallophosphatase superfamily)